MARRVIFFDDELQTQRGFATHLRAHGLDVTTVSSLAEAEALMAHPDCELIVYGGGTPESWQLCQTIVQGAPNFPVLYIFVNDDSREPLVKRDELHQIVRPLSSRAEFLDLAEKLMRIGKLHRRIQELSGMATGSTAVEAMFERLDVHHILDRLLNYFGSRTDFQNVHWLRWQDIPHMLQGDQQALTLELELVALRSPRMLSYRGVEPSHVFGLLRQTLRTDSLLSLTTRDYMVATADKNPILYVLVKSLDGSTPLGILVFEGCPSSEAFSLAPQVLDSLKLMARFVEFGLSHWDGKNLALVDDLTELFNQRYLPTVIENEINRSQRRNAAFTLLFLDLDYFKIVNDTRGHWIGSKLLKEIAQIVKSSIRSCDYGFRYGGDEFVVVLPDTNLKGGQVVGERIRKSVEDTHFLIDGHEIRLTVSVGLAAYPEHAKTKEQIIQLADQAMYYGKRKSRNIVYSAS